MDQAKLGKAARLLAQAEATTFDHEATALAERAYRMVGDVLNAVDDEHRGRGVMPRRDRRRLLDRRVGRRSKREVTVHDAPRDVASNYRLRSGRPGSAPGGQPPGNIDLTA